MQRKLLWINVWLLLLGCADQDTSSAQPTEPSVAEEPAAVLGVEVSGSNNDYQFSVKIMSPDTGCEQYADWWEVISTSGELIYRRILAHSHVNEQPFTRSGGKVAVDVGQTVWVRVHMNNTGYSTRGMKGSVSEGFEPTTLDVGLAADLSSVSPLPSGCNF